MPFPIRLAQHDRHTQQRRDSRETHVLIRDFYALQASMRMPGADVVALFCRQCAIRRQLVQRGVLSA